MASKPYYLGTAVEGQSTFLSEKHTIRWKFCAFNNMKQKRGEKYQSKPLKCHGFSWFLYMYPRGDSNPQTPDDEEYISVFLVKGGGKAVDVAYTIRVEFLSHSSKRSSFTQGTSARGFNAFAKRNEVLTVTRKGALFVEVDIQIFTDEVEPVLPKSRLSHTMLEMLESGKRSDVTFVVGGATFRAHLNILDSGAPVLAELADDVAAGENIVIDNVDDSIFSALLRYVYGEEPPPDEMMASDARGILDAADRFGCVNLKLLAEAWLVETEISSDTATELLLLADAKSCALLKESALNYIRANGKTVMESPGWEEIKKSASLLSEIVEAIHMEKSDLSVGDDVEKMSVATLRRKLQERGESEDGTREMLVERVKAHATKKRRTE